MRGIRCKVALLTYSYDKWLPPVLAEQLDTWRIALKFEPPVLDVTKTFDGQHLSLFQAKVVDDERCMRHELLD